MKRDEEFRKWYDRYGIGLEPVAYETWVAAWGKATQPDICRCESIALCDLNDKCMKESK